MKYVYTEGELNRSIPDNVRGRKATGVAFGIVSVFLLVVSFNFTDFVDIFIGLLLSAVFSAIALLFIFFAIRTEKAILNAETRTPEDILPQDENHPFYSSRCNNCHVLIDYQSYDLAFRLWFIKGYVECPCCGKPIRHDKEKNVFIPHRYPENT